VITPGRRHLSANGYSAVRDDEIAGRVEGDRPAGMQLRLRCLSAIPTEAPHAVPAMVETVPPGVTFRIWWPAGLTKYLSRE